MPIRYTYQIETHTEVEVGSEYHLVSTTEIALSKPKKEIIKEARRMEQSLLYISRGHFAISRFWKNFQLWIGIPIVFFSAIGGANALAQFDTHKIITSIISITLVALTSIMTFLNPNQKANEHLNAGNNYDSLMNKIRIFWSIDCLRDESEQVLTERLKYFSEQKDKLNQSCPQVSSWGYHKTKKDIS